MGISALVGAGISAAGSIFGSSKTSSAAKTAAQAQVQSAQIAANTQEDMFGKAQSALSPYMNLGSSAANTLQNSLSGLVAPVAAPTPQTAQQPLTQADLEAAPGYQFTLGQGLKSTQNSAAARGLGVSGAALKGAATYATGLSDNTYNTRFGQQNTLFNQGTTAFNEAQTAQQDQVQNNINSFNKLYQAAGLGNSAGAALAGQAIQTGNGIAQTQIGSGNAQAAGINTAAQASASGLTGATGAFNNALNQYLVGSNTGGLYGSSSGSGGGLANYFGKNFMNGGF